MHRAHVQGIPAGLTTESLVEYFSAVCSEAGRLESVELPFRGHTGQACLQFDSDKGTGRKYIVYRSSILQLDISRKYFMPQNRQINSWFHLGAELRLRSRLFRVIHTINC